MVFIPDLIARGKAETALAGLAEIADQVDGAIANSTYRPTLAEAIADLPVGTYFSSRDMDGDGPYTGIRWNYKRTVGAPYWEAIDVWVDKNDVGLGNVNNTSDADKPISDATAVALATITDAMVASNTAFFASTKTYPVGTQIRALSGQAWLVVTAGTGHFNHPLSNIGLLVQKNGKGEYPLSAWPVVADGGVHLVSGIWTLTQAQRVAGSWLLDTSRSIDWVCAQAATLAISQKGGGTLRWDVPAIRFVDYEGLLKYSLVNHDFTGMKGYSHYSFCKLPAGIERRSGYATDPVFNWAPVTLSSLTATGFTLTTPAHSSRFTVGGIYNFSNGADGIKANRNEPVLCQLVRITSINTGTGAITVEHPILDIDKWMNPQLGQTRATASAGGGMSTLYNLPDADVWADCWCKGGEFFPDIAPAGDVYHSFNFGMGMYNCKLIDITSHGGPITYGNAMCYSEIIRPKVFVKPCTGPAWFVEMKIGSVATTEIGATYYEEGDVSGLAVTLFNPGEGARDCSSINATYHLPNCSVKAFYPSAAFRARFAGYSGTQRGSTADAESTILLNATELPEIAPLRQHIIEDFTPTFVSGTQKYLINHQGNTLADKGDIIRRISPIMQGIGITGSISGTTLTVTSAPSPVRVGKTVSNIAGTIPMATTILSQLSGTTGGAGTYQLSQNAGTIASDTIWIGATISRAFTSETLSTLTLSDLRSPGSVEMNTPSLNVTGSISGTTLTVTGLGAGVTVKVGATVSNLANTVPTGTTILSQLSGTTGGAGTYQLSQSAGTIASGSLAVGAPPMERFDMLNVTVDRIDFNRINGLRAKGCTFLTAPVASGMTPQFRKRVPYQEIAYTSNADVISLVVPYFSPIAADAEWTEKIEFTLNGTGAVKGSSASVMDFLLKVGGSTQSGATISFENTSGAKYCTWTAKVTMRRINSTQCRFWIEVVTDQTVLAAHSATGTTGSTSLLEGPVSRALRSGIFTWPGPNTSVAARTITLNLGVLLNTSTDTMVVCDAEARYINSALEGCLNG